MGYLPPIVHRRDLDDIDFADLRARPIRLTVVRRLRLERCCVVEPIQQLRLFVQGRRMPISVPAVMLMEFGTESVQAAEYARRVLEPGDLLDVVYDPDIPYRVTCFWIHIEYLEERPSDAEFSEKDDGLFAMRAKAGEKAERIVARDLSSRFGHAYPEGAVRGAGTFQIRYSQKQTRHPDLTCTRCALNIEVKKRNRDTRYRVSHSERRPFQSEHRSQDWHAFVFPDLSIHYLANADLAEEIERGRACPGADRYDAWADIDARVAERDPPTCIPTRNEDR